MTFTRALVLAVLLAAPALVLVPSASATSCAAEPEELEPVVCGVVYTYFCIADQEGALPSHKTVLNCVT